MIKSTRSSALTRCGDCRLPADVQSCCAFSVSSPEIVPNKHNLFHLFITAARCPSLLPCLMLPGSAEIDGLTLQPHTIQYIQVRNACPGAGACGGMYTANTMAAAIETLGMSLPYSSSIPAEDPLKLDECRCRPLPVL